MAEKRVRRLEERVNFDQGLTFEGVGVFLGYLAKETGVSFTYETRALRRVVVTGGETLPIGSEITPRVVSSTMEYEDISGTASKGGKSVDFLVMPDAPESKAKPDARYGGITFGIAGEALTQEIKGAARGFDSSKIALIPSSLVYLG